MTELRVLANLFTASLHVLADTSTGAKTVKDLADVPTVVAMSNPADLLDAQDVFRSCGLQANAGKLVPLPASEALRRFASNEFTVLIRTSPQRDTEIEQVVVARPNTAILGFDQTDVDKICQQQPHLAPDKIRSKQYNNGDELATVGVSCLWVTSPSLDDDVAFGAVERLWEEDTRSVAVQACPFESLLQIDRALAGVASIPVHTGASRFYQKHGIFIR